MKSVLQKDDKCFYCRMAAGTEWHHLFPGRPNRAHSEADGLKVLLCWPCHWKVHNDTQVSGQMMTELKQEGQRAYEETHSREDFVKRYGRNYL